MIVRKLLVLCIFVILLSETASAISVSPPRIILDDVLKGTTVQRTVLLGGIDPGSIITVTLQGDGSEWISLPLGAQFTFPDTEEISVPFVLSIPEQAPNGEYAVKAQVIASPKPGKVGENIAVVSAGLLVDITFSITGQEVKKYRISNVAITKFEQGTPLTIVLTIDNDGNVIAKPSRLDIEVVDRDRKPVFSSSTTQINGVGAFSVGESVVSFATNLLPGLYFADVTVYTDEGRVETNDIPFDVLEPGAFESSGELRELSVQENIDKIAKVTGIFANTGDISYFATLHGEVYRDGSLVKTFETEKAFVEKKSEIDLVHFYTVDGVGDYTIKAQAGFLGKRTSEKEVSFSIRLAEQLEPEKNNNNYAFLVIILGVIAGFIIFARKKGKQMEPVEKPKRARPTQKKRAKKRKKTGAKK